jgi:uncharacterized protein YndB with AHSA1/START domain
MSEPSTEPTRAIRLEVEVPGTPEEVWETVATGPGITSWFVPAEVDGREGGEVTLHFGPGMDERGRVLAWEPPSRFAYEAPPEGERRLAYEFQVEARSGGTCVVRLINSGFGAGADWDGDYDGMDAGWRLFLEVLRLGRTHFPGEGAASVLVGGVAPVPRAQGWTRLTEALGLGAAAAVGEPEAARAEGAPPLAGRVAWSAPTMRILVTDEPARGLVLLASEGGGERSHLSVYLYCFGDGAAEAAAALAPVWRGWMEASFPVAEG